MTTTIKEVAKKARVSVGTVSNVLTGAIPVSPKRSDRVLAVIQELGYKPNHIARSLKLRHTKMLGMIISDITNPFFSHLVRGAEDAALKHKYLLLTFNTDDRIERERQAIEVLRERQVDGILLVVAPTDSGYSHITETLDKGTPVVCLDRVPPKIQVDSVTVNSVKATQDCVRHLIEMGHKEIAILTGSIALQTARQRLQGYKKALAEAGIAVKQEYIRQGEFRASSGYELGKSLLSAPLRPTAVFCSNGMMALGVLKAVEELGLRCPDDLAVAVFDDLPLAEVVRPHLTSVAQPAYSVGYEGAELLMQKIAKKSAGKPVRIVLPTQLKIRESTCGRQRSNL
ncbi:MAG TPA: LacI family DNA-binding transcriptional regulator [Terriglobia bacterium]|nr:LacI family DNA-binding transcriptional regulator [Terriglobia bacterium]